MTQQEKRLKELEKKQKKDAKKEQKLSKTKLLQGKLANNTAESHSKEDEHSHAPPFLFSFIYLP